MKEFLRRITKVLLFAGLILSFWGLGWMLMNGVWWLQDNWIISDQLRTAIMWIGFFVLMGLATYALWNLLKILYIMFYWLFIEPFKKNKITK